VTIAVSNEAREAIAEVEAAHVRDGARLPTVPHDAQATRTDATWEIPLIRDRAAKGRHNRLLLEYVSFRGRLHCHLLDIRRP
jgi:hypothetical protein